MKILHFLVTDKLSGAENVMLSILKSLKDGNEVYYVSPDGPVRAFVEEAGVIFIPADTDSIPEIKRIYNEIKPDIVHACDPRMSFKCAVAGIPFIAHLHNNCPWLKKLSPNSVALLYAVKRAKAVVTVSDSIEKEYIFRKALKDKLYMIPNTVDSHRVEKMGAEECDEKFDIIFIGRMNEQKRPHLFLDFVAEVAKKVPGVTAAMVGEGELFDEISERVQSQGMKNVSLLGFRSNPYKLINNSKINVFTSYYEGFGLVAVESMILSKPVLGYAVGGLAGIITPESGFLCKNNDEMVEAAVKLLTDQNLYDKLSAGAKENSYRFTDTDGYTRKIKTLYDRVLKM